MKLRGPALVLWLVAACDPIPADDASPRGRATSAEVATHALGLQPHLFAIRRGHHGLEPLADGDLARHGDLLQVGYVAAGHTHGVIVSLDGHGHVTLHHPSLPNETPLLRPRGRHPLPHAFELDAAQGFERFVLVVSGAERLDPRQVLAAAREVAERGPDAATTPLPLPWRWHQSSLLLRKPR